MISYIGYKISYIPNKISYMLYKISYKAYKISNIIYKISYFAPAYSKNSGRALSVTPVRPVRLSVRLSVRTSYFRVRAITPKPYGIYS